MASGADHIAAGAITGVAMTGFDPSQLVDINPLFAIGTCTVFSKIQDWVAPAINPHHRQFFHSIGFLVMLGFGLKKTYNWKPEDKCSQIFRFLTLCAGGGYISHLVLDGLTPRSLPLLGKV